MVCVLSCSPHIPNSPPEYVAHDHPPYADTMIYALSKFVSIPSVSSSHQHKEDCRQAAIWLRKCLGQLGAQSFLVSRDGRCIEASH